MDWWSWSRYGPEREIQTFKSGNVEERNKKNVIHMGGLEMGNASLEDIDIDLGVGMNKMKVTAMTLTMMMMIS